MSIKVNQWVYLDNSTWGRMYAADRDKKGDDHIVETNPLGGSGDKYQWRIHQSGNDFFIENKLYGFMYAANDDKKDNDHLIECDPAVKTLSQAVGRKDPKFVWDIRPEGAGHGIVNRRHGKMFAADADKIDNDHHVEASPGRTDTGGKWSWAITDVWSPASWMADSAAGIGDVQLKDLVIPGTHDSGSYACSATSTLAPEQDIPQWVNAVWLLPGIGGVLGAAGMVIIARWARAQGHDIGTQLAAGIRYLDLRVVRDGSGYYTCHSLYSANMTEVIDQIRQFIEKNPKEIVILDFNHLYNMVSPEQHAPLIDAMIAAFGSKMAPSTMSATNLVSDFWRADYQIIALYDNADCVKRHFPKLWPQSKISSPWPETASLSELKTALEANLSSRPNDKFFVLQGILTPTGGMIAKGLVPLTNDPSSLENLAPAVTPQVTRWLQEWAKRNMNIVIVDWFNVSNYVSTIRQINVQKGKP